MTTEATPNGPSTPFAPRHVDEAGLQRAQQGALPVQRYDVDPGPGGILFSTFSWWVSDLKRLTLIGLLPLVITFAVGAAFAVLVGGMLWAQQFAAPAAWLGPLAVVFVLFAVMGVGYVAAAGASVFAVEERARGERTLGAWTCFVYGLGALRRMFGALVLAGFVYVVATAILAGALMLVADIGEVLGITTSTAIFVVHGVFVVGLAFLALRLSPIIPIYVLEELSVFAGLSRAWSLTRGRMRSVGGGALLVGFVSAMGCAFVGAIAWIPVLGWGISVGVMAVIPSLAHTFAFAVYASCLNDDG